MVSEDAIVKLHSLLVKSAKGLTVSQVVCLVHRDALPDRDVALTQLHHLATTSIKIGPPTNSSEGNPTADTTHKKPGGKVQKQVEWYSVDRDNRLKSEDLRLVTPATTEAYKEKCDDTALPEDLTTFKLSLGQQEKQARSQLVLPYLRANSDKGGKVFYHPDAADDWDEEDPDDDLDV